MIIVDANLLLHANDPTSPHRAAARAWLVTAFAGPELVCFAWLTLWAFIRVASNPRLFEQPLSASEAASHVRSWLSRPTVAVLGPGERHWDILQSVIKTGQANGPLVSDAALAAIAIEHGATLCTTDRDFARFPGLKWQNPLEPAR